jgi:hypothetical protein
VAKLYKFGSLETLNKLHSHIQPSKTRNAITVQGNI